MYKVIGFVLLMGLVLVTGAAVAQEPPIQETTLTVGIETVAEGFTSPVFLMEPPDGSGRLFIVDLVGAIWIVTPDGVLLEEPFLDLTAEIVPLMPEYDERGLLGLAFHPNYATNGRFFVFYSIPLRPGAPPGYDHTNRLSEFSVSADPNVADPASEQILLEFNHPQFNHNGGTLAFGPTDGYLYLSEGDGGGANDVGLGHVEDWYDANAGGNGQDITQNLLGNILRLDVNQGSPYGIPPDNPFVGTEGLDEIYAYGFRNPYRFSFDMDGDHNLFVGDAGQNLWEEVSLVISGGNYGWNVKEGTHCFDAENPEVSPRQCPDTAPGGVPLLDPIIEYPNSGSPMGGLGKAVVGGYVYRGDELPRLQGRYIFGDWSTESGVPDGSLFVALPNARGDLWPFRELFIEGQPNGRLEHYLLGFGQDLQGEVYVLTTDNVGPTGNTGRVFKLVNPEVGASTFSTTLTGAAEVPGPGDPDGRGIASLTLNQGESEICFEIAVRDILLPATSAHIHEAPAGASGPVVVTLAPPDAGGVSGGCVTVDVNLMVEIAQSPANYYVNVHNSEFPGGALRGQLPK